MFCCPILSPASFFFFMRVLAPRRSRQHMFGIDAVFCTDDGADSKCRLPSEAYRCHQPTHPPDHQPTNAPHPAPTVLSTTTTLPATFLVRVDSESRSQRRKLPCPRQTPDNMPTPQAKRLREDLGLAFEATARPPSALPVETGNLPPPPRVEVMGDANLWTGSKNGVYTWMDEPLKDRLQYQNARLESFEEGMLKLILDRHSGEEIVPGVVGVPVQSEVWLCLGQPTCLVHFRSPAAEQQHFGQRTTVSKVFLFFLPSFLPSFLPLLRPFPCALCPFYVSPFFPTVPSSSCSFFHLHVFLYSIFAFVLTSSVCFGSFVFSFPSFSFPSPLFPFSCAVFSFLFLPSFLLSVVTVFLFFRLRLSLSPSLSLSFRL